MRQALAGMLWSKQCYYFDLDVWLREHEAHPLRSPRRRGTRNEAWFHMVNHDVISMPDKWEYPWYAAWDLAFHTIALGMVDPDFAKGQLDLMLSQAYLHPTGQIPAYEWSFGDVNPPVHAFATMLIHSLEEGLADGDPDGVDRDFLSLVVQQAAAELHVVGQPQGPGGAQPVRGRLPRPRQRGRVRPQLAAARRAAASSRPTARRGWRCSARTCWSWPASWRSGTRATRSSSSSSWSASSGSPRRWTPSATTPTRCGTRRRASSTTSCASPTGGVSG